MIRLLATTALCALFCVALSHAQAQVDATDSPILQKLRRGEAIVVGHRTNSPPLSFTGEQGPDGYSVDICRAAIQQLAKLMPRRKIAISYQPVTLENRLTKVVAQEIHIECGLTTNTTSRAKQVDFSPTILVTGTKFVVPQSSPLMEPEALSGRAISAGKGTTNLKSARRFGQHRNLNLAFRETGDTKSAFLEMAGGKSDAAALNEISARGWSKEGAGYAVRFLGRYLSTEPVAIALPKHDPAFSKAFSDAVAAVLVSGEAEQIYERWLGRNGLGLPLNQFTREAFRVPLAFSVPDELL